MACMECEAQVGLLHFCWHTGTGTCTLRIYNYTLSPYQLQVNQAYTGALVLILLILITSFTVRWFTGGFRRRF